jgi:ferredoxin
LKVYVDATKCQAYGNCEVISEALFELDEEGFSQPKGDGEVSSELLEEAEQAVGECPAEAIRLEPESDDARQQ